MRRMLRRNARSITQLALYVAGFSALTVAAWSLAWQAGATAAGVSCFLLEWLTQPSPRDAR